MSTWNNNNQRVPRSRETKESNTRTNGEPASRLTTVSQFRRNDASDGTICSISVAATDSREIGR